MRQQWHRHPKTLRVGIKPDVPERYVSHMYRLKNLVPTSVGISTLIAIMLLALTTSCDGERF